MSSGTAMRWLICRICLKDDNIDLFTIFNEMEEESPIAFKNLKEKIELNGGIELINDSSLPSKICSRCLLLLRAACKFRDLCEQSQKQLQPFLKTAAKADENNLKQEENTDTVDAELNEKDDNCMFEEHEHDDNGVGGSDDKAEVTTNEKQAAAQQISEQSTSTSPIRLTENDDDDSTNAILPQNVDELVDEDTSEYIFDPTNESSQDTQEQIINEDTCNTLTMDTMDHDDLHIQYYDDPDDIEPAKFVLPGGAESSGFHEVYLPKPLKRKRREVNNAQKSKADHASVYKCIFCDNVYHDKAKYAVHMKIHNKVRPHECEICCKRFSTTPQLSRHMNSHTGQRPYKCKYCDASFGDPSTKIKHERIHTNERPYKCEFCPKSFAYSNVLKVHRMMHTGERPHVCSFCGKTFSQIHHKNAHEKRHRDAYETEFSESDVVDTEYVFKDFEIEKM